MSSSEDTKHSNLLDGHPQSKEHGDDQTIIKSTSLIIGADEFLKINISNRLNNRNPQNIIAQESLDHAMEYMTGHSVQVVYFDIDQFDNDAIERVYKLITHLEVPCLFISSDPSFLNKLRLEMDTTLVSFLPKTILNSMFNETLDILLKKNIRTKKLTKRIISTSKLPKTKTLYLLAAFLFCEPILKVLYLKFNTGFEWDILMRTIFSIEGVVKNFEFWGIFPLAGYALISVKSWSFFFFIALQTYGLYAFAAYEEFTWPYVAESPHISSSFLLITNLSIVAYFIVPANLRPYWNESRKIWRNTTRFATNIQAFFKHQDQNINTTITNISETGAYFTSNKELEIGNKLLLDLPINGEVKTLEATIRRTQNTAHDKYFGYGVEFHYKNSQDKRDLKEYIETLNQRIQ